MNAPQMATFPFMHLQTPTTKSGSQQGVGPPFVRIVFMEFSLHKVSWVAGGALQLPHASYELTDLHTMQGEVYTWLATGIVAVAVLLFSGQVLAELRRWGRLVGLQPSR